MRALRIAIGAILLVAVTSAALAGVWMLRQAGGGGVPVRVEFADTQGLRADDDILYGDGIVGRIESVDDGVVVARVAAEHASLLRVNSRFWIQSHIGSSVLIFDTPKEGGAQAEPGQTFAGLDKPPKPDPALAPPAVPRKLNARPSWLCELRANIELSAGSDLSEVQRRKTAAVIAGVRENGDLIVLAPSWAVEYSGTMTGETYRIELIGGATYTSEILATRLPWVVLLARETEYRGNPAPFWPETLADGQGLVLCDFEGNAFTAIHTAGEVDLRAKIDHAFVAFIEGTNVAGFTLPAVGKNEGVTWLPLNGAGTAVEEARAKLDK
jgi:hypothetical protein